MASGYEHKSSPPPRTLSGHVARRIQVVPGRTGGSVASSRRVLVTACSSAADVTSGRATSPGRRPCPPAPPNRQPHPEPAGSGTPGAPRPFEPGAIEWEEFADDVDVATLDVPVDYADPSGPTFELFLARHRAADPDERIGSLLVNPGGPGFGGSEFAIFAELVPYDEELLDHFDIIGWDPRGTGQERAVHRLHRRLRPLLRRVRHHARHRAGASSSSSISPRSSPTTASQATPTSSNTSARTTRRATSTRSAERSARTRSRTSASATGASSAANVGDDVPRHRAGGRVRRGEGSERRHRRVDGPAAAGFREHARRRSSPNAAPTPTARSTTTATPRARSTS